MSAKKRKMKTASFDPYFHYQIHITRLTDVTGTETDKSHNTSTASCQQSEKPKQKTFKTQTATKQLFQFLCARIGMTGKTNL